MPLSRFVPEPLIRSVKNRLTAIFSTAPILFFGVVIGVAVLFRVGIGFIREPAEPEVSAPLFAHSASPSSVASAARAAGASTAQPIALSADPAAMPLPVEPPAKAKPKQHGRSVFSHH